MRKNAFCDSIAFFVLLSFVVVGIKTAILIYCAQFFIQIFSVVDYFKREKCFGVAIVLTRSRELP